MINPPSNRTKIIATIGPSSNTERKLLKLIEAGVDVCRLNFSHGTHEEHYQVIQLVRRINIKYRLPVCILADLQGPKIRIGEVEDGSITLKAGETIRFETGSGMGNRERLTMNYKEFPRDVKAGDHILIDDGKIELEVIETNRQDKVVAKAVNGGKISSRKGVNLPNTRISLPSLTEKDLEDLQFALDNDVEWIGLSFVRNVQDIRQLKRLIRDRKKSTKVIAKIEKPEAVENIDEIIEETDGVMIARGDLGVEVPMEHLPLIQKNLVQKSLAAAKPVIIATQIMESMIQNARPTRAEVNDVANAVLDGADALMLSGETSVGKYPIQVIEYMNKIIYEVEAEPQLYTKNHPLNPHSVTFISDALCEQAVRVGQKLDAQAIIGMTKSGYTAFKVSSYRPKAHIYIFSNNIPLLNTLTLLWGVQGFYYNKYVSTDETFKDVQEIICKRGYVKEGDIVINLASMPIHEKQRTNTIKVSRV